MIKMAEKWFKFITMEHDKANHAFHGLFTYSMVSLYSPLLAIIIVAILGIGKEVYDYYIPNHTSDYMDAVYTVVPSLVVYILGVLYVWFTI